MKSGGEGICNVYLFVLFFFIYVNRCTLLSFDFLSSFA